MKLSPWLPAVLLCLPIVPASAAAQTPPVNDQPPQLSNDPGQFLQLAQQQNGLHDLDTPWHVRATWQMLDAKGRPEQQGTWEEWWIGPRQWEEAYDSPTFKETFWGTPQGIFSIHVRGADGWIEHIVTQMVFHPIQPWPNHPVVRPKSTHLQRGPVSLECVTPANIPADSRHAAYCFDVGRADLRMEISPLVQITRNSIIQFQGRYLARNIQVTRMGMPTIDMHLDAVDEPAPLSGGQTAPPPQAKLLSQVPVSVDLQEKGRRITFQQSAYPRLAVLQHIEGTVAMWATVGTDGKVRNVEVIAGPQVFRQAAINSVQTWRYEPYLINGEPVEVGTEIDMRFSIE